jgi:hypothetical protein
MKNCPFCGGEVWHSPSTNAKPIFFYCKNCLVTIYWHLPFKEAMERWEDLREYEEYCDDE